MPTTKRILRWVLAAFAVVVMLVIVAAGVLHTRRFQQYILAKAIKAVQKSTGARLEIGNWAIHWDGLSVDLYAVVVHGTEPAASPPLFVAEHLAVGLKLRWSQDDKVSLRSAVIDHPVIHLLATAPKGTNIPAGPPKPSGSKSVDIFDLAIGRLELNNGEIHYNDQSIPLDLDLRDVNTNVIFDPSQRAYRGTLGYRQSVIQYAHLNSFAHELQARFTATSSSFAVTTLMLKTGASWFSAAGQIDNYSNPSVKGSYRAALFTGEIASLLKQTSLPTGEVDIEGTIGYDSKTDVPMIENISATGTFRSPRLRLELPQARADLRILSGDYRLSQGVLELSSVKGDLFDGQATGELRMANLRGTPRTNVQVALQNLSFAAIQNAIRPNLLPGTRTGGRFSANASASWRGSLQDLQARADAVLGASVASTSQNAAPIPLNGTLHLNYDAMRQTLALRDTSLRTPNSSVVLSGELSDRAKLLVEVNSADLREIDQIMLAFENAGAEPAASGKPPEPLGLAGSASFIATATGQVKNPRLVGALKVADLRYRGINLPALRTNVDLSPSRLALNQGRVQIGSEGRVDFDIDAGLRNWSFTPNGPVRAHVAAARLPVEDLEHLAGQRYPVTGILNANLTFNGSEESPSGEGSIELAQASAWEQPIQNLTVRFQGTGKEIHSIGNVVTRAGSANVDVTYLPKDKAYAVQLKLPALKLEELQLLKSRNSRITGELAMSASGRGTLQDPQLQITAEFPTLQIDEQNLNGLKGEATVAHQQAAFKLNSSVLGAALRAQGTVNMDSRWDTTATIDSEMIQIGPLLRAFVPQAPAGMQGQLQVHGSLRGPLKDPNELHAAIEIPSFNLDYQPVQIAAKGPIRMNYHGGILTLEHSELTGTGTDFQFDATIPLQAPGDLQARALGTIDLHLMQILNSSLNSNGAIEVNVTAGGNRAAPKVRGTIRINNGSVVMPHEPLGVEKLNAELNIDGGRIEVKSFSAQAGGGQVVLRGFAAYQPSVQFNLGVNAKSVRLLYPDGVRTLFDSELDLTGTKDSAMLNGQVSINQLSLTPSFDLSTFADQFTGPSSPPATGFVEKVKLNVGIISSQQLALASSQLNIQGAANLQVRGTLADPVILGRTTLTGGDIFFQSRRFTLQNGTIQFVNPVKTEAVVNLRVSTTVEQFNLNLGFVGPLDRLQTTYTSDPTLPPVDVINLLFTGHTTQAGQTSVANPQSLLASQLAGQVSSRVQKLTGISSLTIDPQIGGNQGNAASQVAIQERVSKNLFFTFATDLTTTQGEVVQVEYQVTRKYSMSAVRDQTGGYQVEVKSKKKF